MQINASCVTSFVPGCDAVTTTQTRAYALGLYPGTTYAVETSAVMFQPHDTLKPWEFLSPFSWVLWISICVLAAVITPVVTALVEYSKDGNTVAKSAATFLPDSVHAYAGVDTLKRTGDAFTADSALLSAVVALVTRVLVAMYQCNLVAYVIFSYMGSQGSTLGAFESVATTPEFYDAHVRASSTRVFESQTAALSSYVSGSSDAVVGSDAFLETRASCVDHVAQISGPRTFDVLAYATKNTAANFDDAFERAVAARPFGVVANVGCDPVAKSITLNETLGVFVAFGACMAFVSAMAVIVHVTRHENFCARRKAPESPESLPESIHA